MLVARVAVIRTGKGVHGRTYGDGFLYKTLDEAKEAMDTGEEFMADIPVEIVEIDADQPGVEHLGSVIRAMEPVFGKGGFAYLFADLVERAIIVGDEMACRRIQRALEPARPSP